MNTKYLFIFLFSIQLSGCVTTRVTEDVNEIDKQWLLTTGPLLGNEDLPLDLPEKDLLSLSPEMKKFADSIKYSTVSDEWALRELVNAIHHNGYMGIKFAPEATYTAQEAFLHGKANCLAFTKVVVALARHMGLRASFNEVDTPSVWDLQNESTLVLYKHVNAVIRLRDGTRHVVDINMEDYDISYSQRKISDKLAGAQYYNNRAMELLSSDNHFDAFRYLVRALELAPRASYLWSNLGSIYRRAGKLNAAELAYRVAIQEDPGNHLAISNAARLYRQLGDTDRAEKLLAKAERFRKNNPYYRYKLAMKSYLKNDFDSAMENIHAAIKLYKKEHRFYFLLGAIYRHAGDYDRAEENLDKAIDLSFIPEQRSIYLRKKELLLSSRNN